MKFSERRQAQVLSVCITIGLALVALRFQGAFASGTLTLIDKDAATTFEGFSNPEDFGRWTIGPVGRISFTRPLPRRFTLTVRAHAYADNAGKPVAVRVGGKRRGELMLTNTDADYAIDIDNPLVASDLEFVIPQPESPQSRRESADSRMLGVAFSALAIRPR